MIWGVLGAAVGALAAFVERKGYGTVRFRVYDGAGQVGVGSWCREGEGRVDALAWMAIYIFIFVLRRGYLGGHVRVFRSGWVGYTCDVLARRREVLGPDGRLVLAW